MSKREILDELHRGASAGADPTCKCKPYSVCDLHAEGNLYTDNATSAGADPQDCQHRTEWAVLSDDGEVYEVEGRTREKAEAEAALLRQPDEDGHSEPGATIIERRICGWVTAGVGLPRKRETRGDSAGADPKPHGWVEAVNRSVDDWECRCGAFGSHLWMGFAHHLMDRLAEARAQGGPSLDVFREAAADAHSGWLLYELERDGKTQHAKEWGDCTVPACAARLGVAPEPAE